MLVTTCPDCDTTFKLTVAILEKAGGQVRCGRCARIFDANSRLREQPETETERLPPATREQTSAQAGDALPFAVAGRAARPGDTSSRGYLREDPPEVEPASAGLDEPDTDDADTEFTQTAPGDTELTDVAVALSEIADSEDTVESASVTEPAAAAPAAAEPVAAEPVAAEPAAAALVAAEPVAGEPAPGESAIPPAREPVVGAPLAPVQWAPAAEATEPSVWPDEDLAPVRRRVWPWAVGTGLLALTLAAQLIHAQRSDLAALPHIGPVLIATYARFGHELSPPVVLEQYLTLDLTAVAEPVTDEHGWLIIETRVQNRGPTVQPYPYILVRLLDRWTETIAGRYFSPDEYLVTPLDDYSRMNAGATVDAQFIIVDPGPSATGFELEFCTKVGSSFRCESQ
jgi:predicted Zn finger-like uncharacterized protein